MPQSVTDSAYNDIETASLVSSYEDDFKATTEEVMRELFVHVQELCNDGSVTFGAIMDALRHEGILFWRDRRWAKSQERFVDLAIRLYPSHGDVEINKKWLARVTGRRDRSHLTEEEKCIVENLRRVHLTYEDFVWAISPCAYLYMKAFSGEFIISDWNGFCLDIANLYTQCMRNREGANADYIPILRDAESEYWGVSVCSVDGQRFNIGDTNIPYTIQSTSKPVTYAIGLCREGENFVSRWIDVEPAGRPFNTQDLDPETQRPFNASINAGAIMAAGVVASHYIDKEDHHHPNPRPSITRTTPGGHVEIDSSMAPSAMLDLDELNLDDEALSTVDVARDHHGDGDSLHVSSNRSVNTNHGMDIGADFQVDDIQRMGKYVNWRKVVHDVAHVWAELSGHDSKIRLSEETFKSERSSAYNNFAIAYNLRGRCGLPRDVSLHSMLDVYLGCCSLEITAEAMSVAAATLANGGVCPITGIEVFPAAVVRHVLAETMTCGMYDQAGHFVVEVGLPAKSGVSGALMIIAPNVCGFATFSPRLNSAGNSVRGVEFCERLVGTYRMHIFEPLNGGSGGSKIDPRQNGSRSQRLTHTRLAWALEAGDVWATRFRDILLRLMLWVGSDSTEGLSPRVVDRIQELYKNIFVMPISDDVLEAARKDICACENKIECIRELLHRIRLQDGMRKIIGMMLREIALIDGRIEEAERDTIVSIGEVLGIKREVTMLELDKSQATLEFDKESGCSQLQELQNAADAQSRGISGAVHINPENRTSQGKEALLTAIENASPPIALDEMMALRAENSQLKKRIKRMNKLMTDMLHYNSVAKVTLENAGLVGEARKIRIASYKP
eukprot:Clim_evm27s44 gene=Clim_evmTU27s44